MPLQAKLFAGDARLEAAATSNPDHILLGAAGPHVGKIQQALIVLDEAAIDQAELSTQRFGQSTAAAVLAYKRKRNIVNRSYQTTPDAIVGIMTMASLDREMAARDVQPNDLSVEIEGPYRHRQLRDVPVAVLAFAPAMLSGLTPVASAFALVGAPRRPRPRPAPPPAPPPPTIIAITNVPQMPLMSFKANVRGADPTVVMTTSFNWVLNIRFDASTCRNGPARNINLTLNDTVQGDTWIPFFSSIRGGMMDVAVTATINGTQIHDTASNIRIVATNPTRTDLFAALPSKALRRVALQESGGGRQFLAAADGGVGPCPLWSGDRLGGVGIMQITRPAPTDDEVWNWRSNVAGGIRIFNQKLGIARGYPAQVRASAGFGTRVAAFNATRPGRPLTIRVPDFTTGDFDDNLQQLELDTIRGFNGFGGRDGMGNPLHEFRLAMRGGLLHVVNINERTRTGDAVWERVPAADRPQGFGDPNYVAHVLGQRL